MFDSTNDHFNLSPMFLNCLLLDLSVMNIEQWTIARPPLVHSRSVDLNLLLRATLQSLVHSQCFSHTTNEKKEVNKSFSVQWPPNF